MTEGIEYLGYGIYCIDLKEENRHWRTCSYIVKDKKIVIIEAGPAPSNKYILSALDELKISYKDVDAVIVTHIHLDHSGGAGRLIQSLPGAKLIVHKLGAKHIIDPTKLIESSINVYGEQFQELFSPILPVPEEKVIIKGEGDVYELREGRSLQFFDSPGHALHHFFIYDPSSQGIFSGDSAGIFYREIWKVHQVELILPTSTPTQFDPVAMENTLNRMLALNPKRIYYTHFGMVEKANEKLEEVKRWLPLFSLKAVEHYHKHQSWEEIARFLRHEIHTYLEEQGIPKTSSVWISLETDIKLNAMGIESYLKRLERQKN